MKVTKVGEYEKLTKNRYEMYNKRLCVSMFICCVDVLVRGHVGFQS